MMELLKSLKIDQICGEKCLDNIMFSIGPITALIAARYGVRTWLAYEITATVFFAFVQFFVPEYGLFSIVLNSPLDEYQRFLCKLDAAYLVYAVLLPICLWKSKDDSVFFGHFWSQLIANTLIMVENLFWYKDSTHWNYKLLCQSVSFSFFLILINAYFLTKCKKPRGFDNFDQDKANYIAKIESFMILTVGLIMFSSPEKAMIGISGLNHVHKSLCRLCGIWLLTRSFESFCVSDYVYSSDKKNFMLSRLLGSLFEMIVVLLGFYYYKSFGQVAFCIYMTINMSYNSLVLYGYLVTPKDFHAKKN